MRIRIRFTKLGKVRFTSHRDVARMWERGLRRAAVPVARTQGFSPRPKLHFGLALSTGYESWAEYLDVDVEDGTVVELASLPAQLSAVLPGGIDATAAADLPAGTPSLQHAVTSSRWEIEVPDLDPAAARARVEELLDAPELVVTRQRKGTDVTDDIRPHLHHVELRPQPGGVLLVAELGTQNRGLRPSELVALLGDGARESRVCRTHQFTEHDGTRSEPLVAGPASPAPHALERAS